MPTIPTLRTRLLDLAAGIGMAGPGLMVLYSYDSRPPWTTAAVVTLLLVAISVWVLWRRSGQRSTALAIAFAGIATATVALGDGVLYYGIIWAACLVLGVTFSTGLWLLAYAAALVVLVCALHVSSGSSEELILTETIGTAFFAGMAAAVAAVLRDSLRVGDALHDALVRLDAANGELRRRMDADRDLVLAHERERTARDLHDDLGHRMTAIGLSLDYAIRVGDRDAARSELERARGLVSGSLDAMRRLVRAMHPVELGTLPDAEAFGAVADAFRGTGIEIAVTVDGGEAPLPHDQSLLLLRFVQEGLTNVVRHANATAAELRVTVGSDGVRASIEDRGGDAAAGTEVAVREGFGLRSLRTRAEALDGSLEASRTAAGFRIAIVLPSGRSRDGVDAAALSAARA